MTHMHILIKNGRIIDPLQKIDRKANLYVGEGRILSVSRKPSGFSPDHEIDAHGCIVLPGLVDLSASLSDGKDIECGNTTRELAASARGGVTSLCCPPDSVRGMDKATVIGSMLSHCRHADNATVYCLGGMTQGLQGHQLSEMQALKNAGCIAVSNANAPIDEGIVLRRCLEYARSCDLPVFFFAEDSSLRNAGVIHEGEISTRLGLPAIPETAETVAIARVLLLAEQTGIRLHLCRLSSSRAMEMVGAAQRSGLPVSADVDICHLLLTDRDVGYFNSMCHLRPPLRTRTDRAALLRGLSEGVIAAVCSDHRPLDEDAKTRPFALTEPGASTVELLLPLMLRLVEEEQDLTLDVAVAALTHRPAAIIGTDAGSLTVGGNADICVVDPEAAWTVDRNSLLSFGKNCPFNGWMLPACVKYTLHKGRIVYSRENDDAAP